MLMKRLVACILCRDGMVVQSVQFRHTNVVGNAYTSVDFWNSWGIDEIILLDVSKTTQNREKFHKILLKLSERCFIPLAVGGWVTSLEEVKTLMCEGADKVIINTAVYQEPYLIREIADTWGSQAVVVSIDVKGWHCQIERGTVDTGLQPVEFAIDCQSRGAGEIFLTSIERDGMKLGYDLDLIREVSSNVQIPVIASGGVGNWQHLIEGLEAGADAVSVANAFHYSEQSTKKARKYLVDHGIQVRGVEFYQNPLNREVVYDER